MLKQNPPILYYRYSWWIFQSLKRVGPSDVDFKKHDAFINIFKIRSTPDHDFVNSIVCENER